LCCRVVAPIYILYTLFILLANSWGVISMIWNFWHFKLLIFLEMPIHPTLGGILGPFNMKYKGYNGYTKFLETSPESWAIAQLYLNLTSLSYTLTIYHALKTKITYTPQISDAPTLGVRNNMLSIHLKIFYSYTKNRHKNKIVRTNALSSCECLSWKVSIIEREA